MQALKANIVAVNHTPPWWTPTRGCSWRIPNKCVASGCCASRTARRLLMVRCPSPQAILGSAEAVGLADPRSHLVGSLQGVYKKYAHLELALPAMGYGEEQTRDLQETINGSSGRRRVRSIEPLVSSTMPNVSPDARTSCFTSASSRP